MPNTYREQAEDRFTRSLAFMAKAESLLQDDLVNRSALADSVSAIKNMLQGYLLLRVSQIPPSGVTQRWQEVAAGNSMPDLIQCCADAGLSLAGLAFEIKQLNKERNQRMHDDPSRRVDGQQARKALELAHTVQKRIKAAVRGEPISEPASQPAAVQRFAAVTRAAVSGRLNRNLLKSVTAPPSPASAPATPAPPTPAPAVSTEAPAPETRAADVADGDTAGKPILPPAETPAMHVRDTAETAARTAAQSMPSTPTEPGEHDTVAAFHTATPDDAIASDDDTDDDGDDTASDTHEFDAIMPLRRPRHRIAAVLLRGLAAAVLLLVGIAAGAGLTVPVVEGHAPAWLAFTSNVLPTAPTATVAAPTPAATATATPQRGPLFAGGFMVSAPTCAGPGLLSLDLHNSATTPALWAAGSPDGSGAAFSLRPGVTGAPTLTGTLASGRSTTVYVADTSGTSYTVVVVAPAGTIQLLAPAC